MRVSMDRQARTVAAKTQSDDRAGTAGSALKSSDGLTKAHELAAGLACGAVLGGIYGGTSFGWPAALGGASFGAFAAMAVLATFWSLRTFLERETAAETNASIPLKTPEFSGVNKSAIVATQGKREVSLPLQLLLWTVAGALLGALAGAGMAALVDAPDITRGAVRIAPACAALGLLLRLTALPLRSLTD